jgi:hypothetical protein
MNRSFTSHSARLIRITVPSVICAWKMDPVLFRLFRLGASGKSRYQEFTTSIPQILRIDSVHSAFSDPPSRSDTDFLLSRSTVYAFGRREHERVTSTRQFNDGVSVCVAFRKRPDGVWVGSTSFSSVQKRASRSVGFS